MDELLTNLLDLAEGQARKVLVEDREDELLPTFVLVAPDGGLTIVGCPWRGDFEKRVILAALRDKARELDAIAVSHLSEAWVTTYPADTDLDTVTAPSQSPDRKEVVIAVATDGVSTEVRLFDIKRNTTGKVIELTLDRQGSKLSMFSGRMIDGILPNVTKH